MQKAVTSFTDYLIPDYLIPNIDLSNIIPTEFSSTLTLTHPNPPVDAPTFYVYPYSKLIRWCV